ncbi:aromatic acid exporter family protein [Streptomyces sp. NPDC091268]|uniref:FUSC family protein n=1 Tax=Streptomyces sp. NPDC091268 TaxID=3365979 RepID=UPI003812F174
MLRALREPGVERVRAIQALKAAAAAIAAWAVAGWWWEAPMAMMAPWSAVLIVRATVYQSVRCAVQQFLAIALGTVAAAGAGTLTGGTLTAMVIALPLTALAGSHPKFGEYGLSASATAVFVLTYSSYSGTAIGHRLVECLVGSVIGVAVNALVLPPLDLRQVEESLVHMRRRAADLLSAIAEGVGHGRDVQSAAQQWHEESRRLGSALTALREARHRTGESCRMNPVVLVRGGPEALPAEWWDEHWERLAEHVRALTGTLVHAGAEPGRPPPPLPAVAELAGVLAAASRLCALEPVSTQEQGPYAYDSRDFEEVRRTAWEAHARLTASATGTGADMAGAAVIGALSAHTRHLLEELDQTRRRAPEPRTPGRRGPRSRRRGARSGSRRVSRRRASSHPVEHDARPMGHPEAAARGPCARSSPPDPLRLIDLRA